MKIGYKGFNKDLKCRDDQFVIGQTYTKPEKESLKLCSADGYHYCNTLSDVFNHYPLGSTENRFCEIEVLGNFKDENSSSPKSITTSFRIVREIPKDELLQKEMESNLNLDLIKDIQTQYPMFHVGGSAGLFLHGIRLKRWSSRTSHSDIDLVAPYFVLPDGKIGDNDIEYLDAKASGNDFDETFIVDGVKVDYRIDPKQRYELIEYNGYKYKVSNVLTILEAKLKYALTPNGQKHKHDILEMIGAKKNNKSITSLLDDLF